MCNSYTLHTEAELYTGGGGGGEGELPLPWFSGLAAYTFMHTVELMHLGSLPYLCIKNEIMVPLHVVTLII